MTYVRPGRHGRWTNLRIPEDLQRALDASRRHGESESNALRRAAYRGLRMAAPAEAERRAAYLAGYRAALDDVDRAAERLRASLNRRALGEGEGGR